MKADKRQLSFSSAPSGDHRRIQKIRPDKRRTETTEKPVPQPPLVETGEIRPGLKIIIERPDDGLDVNDLPAGAEWSRRRR